jgi:hypothetical protein
MHEGAAFQASDETLPVTEYAIRKLNTYNLSHLLLMGNTTDFTGTPLEKLADDGMFRHFRPLFKGALIANVKMDRGAQRSEFFLRFCQTASAVQSLCPSNSFTTAVMFSSPRPSLMALRKIFRIAVMAGAFSSPPAV